ncbi:MAG: dTDP-glucose 4,6-dehydratase [Patescibacteria group bacterium]
MKLLVTGGAGFIGANFILYWFENYPTDEIVNLDKLTYAANLNSLDSIKDFKNYKFVQGDICDESIVNDLVQMVDVVVHFAAESSVDKSLSESQLFFKTNVEGTGSILKVVQKYNKRFHHVSTDEVFGSLELKSEEKFSENTPYHPNNPYSESKAASDLLVKKYFDDYGTKVTLSNCSNNYGPYQNTEKFIPLFITNLLQNKPVPLYGTGKNVRDWLYVKDHCFAIDLILQKGKLGEQYCIGGDSEFSNLAVATEIFKILDQNAAYLDFVEDRINHDLRYAIDHSKITNELGWRPTIKFKQGLAETIEWYKNNEPWWKK